MCPIHSLLNLLQNQKQNFNRPHRSECLPCGARTRTPSQAAQAPSHSPAAPSRRQLREAAPDPGGLRSTRPVAANQGCKFHRPTATVTDPARVSAPPLPTQARGSHARPFAAAAGTPRLGAVLHQGAPESELTLLRVAPGVLLHSGSLAHAPRSLPRTPAPLTKQAVSPRCPSGSQKLPMSPRLHTANH